MSDAENTFEGEDKEPTELEMLKARADQMGIRYANKIGVDALKKKVNAALKDETDEDDEDDEDEDMAEKPARKVKAKSKQEIYAETHQRLQRDEMKLVRVRINCVNPAKADIHGEIICIANKYLGIVKKFVPFGDATEEGYHLPHCLYTEMKSRKYLSLRSYKDRKTQQTVVEQKWLPEFSIEVLDPLSEKELAELARMQAAKEGL